MKPAPVTALLIVGAAVEIGDDAEPSYLQAGSRTDGRWDGEVTGRSWSRNRTWARQPYWLFSHQDVVIIKVASEAHRSSSLLSVRPHDDASRGFRQSTSMADAQAIDCGYGLECYCGFIGATLYSFDATRSANTPHTNTTTGRQADRQQGWSES